MANWDDAVKACAFLDSDSNATLAMIKSKEEQDFIEDYLFNQKNVIENVWIGAKRSNADKEFRWVNGTKFDFENWKEGEPNKRDSKNCVQIIGNEDLMKIKSRTQLGRWSNTECERHNFILLCQKTQDIAFTK